MTIEGCVRELPLLVSYVRRVGSAICLASMSARFRESAVFLPVREQVTMHGYRIIGLASSILLLLSIG